MESIRSIVLVGFFFSTRSRGCAVAGMRCGYPFLVEARLGPGTGLWVLNSDLVGIANTFWKYFSKGEKIWSSVPIVGICDQH